MSTERELLHRIDERLSTHMDTSGVWQQATTEQIKGIEKELASQHVRVDRLEQKEIGRAKLTWMAVAAAISSLAATLKDYFTRGSA